MRARMISKTDNRRFYYSIFGSIYTKRKLKYLSRYRNAEGQKGVIVEEESTSLITFPFLRRALEVRLTNSLGHVSRTLAVYAVLPSDAPVFTVCLNGDIEGLQKLFINGTVSPFVQNEWGWTLLHVCS